MIVTIATIYNHVVKRVLFENGKASDVLYYDAMKKLGISNNQLKSFPMLLIGFGNEEVKVQGIVTLSLTLGEERKTTTTMVDFMVVKVPSANNVLLGRPSQNALRVVGFSPYLKVKFPTPYFMGEGKRDQQVERQCYNTTIKLKGKKSA